MGLRLDHQSWQAPVEAPRERPRTAPEELEDGGEQYQPDHERVKEHCGRHQDAEQLYVRFPLRANAPNTATITAAAAVITRPVCASPSRIAALASPRRCHSSWTRKIEEYLVVHREAEDDREPHHRDKRVDRAGLEAEQPASLKHGLDDPKRGADR